MSTELAGHVEDYLRLRRALGFKLARPGQLGAHRVPPTGHGRATVRSWSTSTRA